MSQWKKMPLTMRILLCAIALAAGMLFPGATRVQDGVNNLVTERQNALQKSKRIVHTWLDAMPEEKRAEWRKLADSNPELFLRAAAPALTVCDRMP